ncbi:MAG: DUF2442 domain-containing protein [Clostridia bacterium]|nr:DUF2442 domain-containing protein [Clostridia bacterium]
MSTSLTEVKALPGYRIQLDFRNGSTAIVNMEQRVRTLRFSCLSSESLFSTAKAEGDKVVWADGKNTFWVYYGELLDALAMD